MVLTKNLYRHDEVVSAFLYSLKQRRTTETHFWLKELNESGYEKDVRGLLLVAWVMRIGLVRVAWLYDWACNTSSETTMLLCNDLNAIQERDSSLWWILWYAVTQETAPKLTFDEAIAKKNLAVAWWHLSRFSNEAFWKYVKDSTNHHQPNAHLVQPILGGLQGIEGSQGLYGIFARLTAIALVFTHSELPPGTWKRCKSITSEDTIKLYEKMASLSTHVVRKQRLYSVPWECLFGMTARGCGHSTEEELLSKLERGLRQSPTWQSRILPFQTERGKWLNDLVQERFYDTYFYYVDGDIPDEWSKKDRHKSHGPHISNCTGGLFGRWWRNWSFQEHSHIQGVHVQNVQQWMNEYLINLDETIFETLEGLYSQLTEKVV